MQRREGWRDMTHPPDSTISVLVPAGAGHTHFAAKIAAVLGAPKHVLGAERRQAKPPPDGLRTLAEAARKLRCSVKTLRAHVAAGDLRYVIIGKGTKRPRIRFTAADLDEFIANQTRKDVPCPSTKTETVARRTSISISKSKVIGFMEARSRRRDAKPKR